MKVFQGNLYDDYCLNLCCLFKQISNVSYRPIYWNLRLTFFSTMHVINGYARIYCFMAYHENITIVQYDVECMPYLSDKWLFTYHLCRHVVIFMLNYLCQFVKDYYQGSLSSGISCTPILCCTEDNDLHVTFDANFSFRNYVCKSIQNNLMIIMHFR